MEGRLQKADVLAYLPKTFWQRRIAYWSGKYSHVSLLFSPEYGIQIEAQRRIILSRIPIDREIHVFRLKDEIRKNFNEDTAWDWALEQLGKRYPYSDLLVFLLGRMFPEGDWLRWNIKRLFFCSEFALRFFQEGGVLLKYDGRNMSPTDLVNLNKFVRVL